MVVTGKSLDSPDKQNVNKMSEKCREKMSEKCPKIVLRGRKHNFRAFFGTIFAYLVDAFVWSPCPMPARHNSLILKDFFGPRSLNQYCAQPPAPVVAATNEAFRQRTSCTATSLPSIEAPPSSYGLHGKLRGIGRMVT